MQKLKSNKLQEAENAWRPTCISKEVAANDEEAKTDTLFRKVRGVLNKLTPQKFNTLVSQVRTLHIDNCERLQGVIDLVFEKAVNEPNFSVAYALMCRELALIKVPVASKNIYNKTSFSELLIMKCQKEFAKVVNLKDIENEVDLEKKSELQMALDKENRKLCKKSVGIMRFIGELFKQQMLTESIVVRCLQNLVDTIEEESLECLCMLLATIGRDLEVDKKINLSLFFYKIQKIVNQKHGMISSRIKFMLQDVIELRESYWIPYRASKWIPFRTMVISRPSTRYRRRPNTSVDDIHLSPHMRFTSLDRGSTIEDTKFYATMDKVNTTKNKVNTTTDKVNVTKDKVNATTEVIDVKPRLPYAPGQWSPENPEGNKVYSREFLILLREDPKSKARPKDIPKEYLTTPADNNRIQKKAEHEQMNIQRMNFGQQSNTPRKDDNRQRLGAGGKRSSVTEDGWSTPASRSRQTYSVQTQKLASVDDIQLGSRMTFTSWGRGSTVTKNNATAQPALPSSTKKYAALEHINAEQERTRPRNGSKEPYSSRRPSMERSFNKSFFKGSSQAPSRDGSQARQTPPTPAPAPAPTPVAPARPAEPTPVLPQLSIKELKTRASNTLDEFLNDCSDVKECEAEIRQTFPASFMAEFVTECYNHVIDRSSTARVATGKLMAHLISVNILSLVDYCTGLKVILSVADELCIDIPNFWLCLAEMIALLLLESVLPLRMLHGICTDVIRLDFGDKLLQFLFNKISEEKGQAFVQQMWQESELSFTDFMSQNKVAEFIKNTVY